MHAVRRSITVAGSMMLALSASQTFGAILFNGAASSITFTHDVLEGGDIDRVVTITGAGIPTGGGTTFALPDLTLTNSLGTGTVTSRAAAGMGQTTTSTTGTGVIRSGTLVTQKDTSDPMDPDHHVPSVLTIDYDLRWTVTPPRYGPPIVGSFNVPLLAVIGAGGTGKAEIVSMEWIREVAGVPTSLRSAVTSPVTPGSVVNFTPGSTLSALTVQSAAFSPGSLNTGDILIVRGQVKISVDNAEDPVSFYYDTPTYDQLVSNDAPVIYHRFNEPGAAFPNPAVGTVLDSSPAGSNNGLYTGNPIYTNGIKDTGIDFGGGSGAVQNNNLQSSQNFSVEFWAASNEPGSWSNPGAFVNIPGANGLSISTNGSPQIQLNITDNLGVVQPALVFNQPPTDITQFHHFVFTFDDATNLAQLFFDGNPVASQNVAGVNRANGTMQSLFLGQNLFGRMDEFAIYDYVLRPEVIASHNLLGRTDTDALPRIFGAEIVEIPEPATAVMGLGALAALAMRRRRTV